MRPAAVPLGDLVVHIRNGLSISNHGGSGGIPITRIETISEHRIDPKRVGYAGVALGERDDWLLQEGDILLSHINSVAHLGKCALYEGQPERLLHGMNLLSIRPKLELLLPGYLLRALRSGPFRDQLAKHIKPSVNQASVSIEALKTLIVPVPTLPEQRRIAAILDKADAIRRKRQEAIALTEQLLRSTFLEMFGDPVTNPKRWPEVTLGDVASIRTGRTPSRDLPENYGGTVPWIKTTEVRGGVILDSEEHLSPVGLKGMEVFPEGSILLAMYGQGSTRGRVAVLGVPAATNQACAVLLPGPLVERDFLWVYLQLSYDALREVSRGGNQLNLNLSLVRSFSLPLPPLLLQQKFAAICSRIDAIMQRQLGVARYSDSLFNSLGHRAFTGQL